MENEKKELEREIAELVKIRKFIDDCDLPHYRIAHLLQELSQEVAEIQWEIRKIDEGI